MFKFFERLFGSSNDGHIPIKHTEEEFIYSGNEYMILMGAEKRVISGVIKREYYMMGSERFEGRVEIRIDE